MISLMPYIGGKHRMAREIALRLHATGADTLIDVFGGSAAVLLNAGFQKRIYNDASADLVNMFRVLADKQLLNDLLFKLHWTPCSRRIFQDDYSVYLRGGLSFRLITDPIERARATLYRHLFSWGGKARSGGFSVSTGDRCAIKEVGRYQRVLTKLDEIGAYFRGTCIENLDYQAAITMYGQKRNHVLFCDPPYIGTENYYAETFKEADHVFLSEQLNQIPAAVVLTYYDVPLVHELYPESLWQYETVCVTKNCQLKQGNKKKLAELILTRKAHP
ncbi:MAG: DNA adenine methylase [Gallionella sp.]|jgi:DNA adenine methylase